MACLNLSSGKTAEAPLTVVVAAGEHLGLGIMIVTNSTGDLLLQLFDYIFTFSHCPSS